MKIKIGSPVSGENFYPRPELIRRIVRAVERGHVAFLGPRRTGKTSCLREIHANPPSGYIAIFLNLEKHDNVAAWLGDMLASVREALNQPESKLQWLAQRGRAFLKRIEELQVPGGGIKLSSTGQPQPWRSPAEEFLRLLRETDAPFLFLLDEFPVFLTLVARKSSPEEVEAVLNWFRAARNELSDRSTRFLVSGSIGLRGVVRRLGLSPSINDFDTLEIPPLKDDEAMQLLQHLAQDNDIELDEKGRRQILKLLGANWPILLQLFVSEIQDTDGKKAPTKADLERLYQQRIVAGNRNEYCAGMFTRLKQAFSESECRLAREILKSLVRSSTGFSRGDIEAIHARLVQDDEHRALLADELDFVIETLTHDGYLLQESVGEQRMRFGSNILRDYWLRKTA